MDFAYTDFASSLELTCKDWPSSDSCTNNSNLEWMRAGLYSKFIIIIININIPPPLAIITHQLLFNSTNINI